MKINHVMLMSLFCFTQVQAFTLPRQPTKAYECDVCDKLSRETLHEKWGISNEPLNLPISNSQKSYSFRQQVSMEELRAGVTLTTLAAGAVIRVTPLQNKAIPNLQLTTPSNQLLSLTEASALYSQDESLTPGRQLTEHQTMLQLKPELGAGNFTLMSRDKKAEKSDAYIISVFDKYSLAYLQVETDAVHYQYGDKLTATVSLRSDSTDYSVDDINATLIGPNGQNVPLKLTEKRRNVFQGSTPLLSEVNDHGGNWYIEAEIVSRFKQNFFKRSGHAAFSYSVPSASLVNIRKLSTKPLTFVATVEVATPSRYALQSVLFHKSGKGEAKPIETSQRAQWLEPGKQVIQFTFDNTSQFADDSLYLGYLRLVDYGQLKTVYQFNQTIKLNQLVD